ncbi:MAG TPA: helix-turn-helix transcriptional regulator [Thermoanaerobaculia bacterium]|nr:helix-turn-helix transcriptional regulator [Thermoanaerobaculia bacterium]
MEREPTNAFRNLGKTLVLLRELVGKSQAEVARNAQIGKSQLSKYENGKELPKLESLAKVLEALELSYWDFFYSLALIDEREASLGRGDLTPRLIPLGQGSLESVFSRITDDLFALHRAWTLQSLRLGGSGDEL